MYYKTGMFVYALAFLLGIVFVQQLVVLPALSFVIVLVLSLLLLYSLLSNSQYCFAFKSQITLILLIISLILFGILYSSFFAKQQLSFRLDENFIGKDLLINGFVSSIPVSNEKAQRFELIITELGILRTDGTLMESVLAVQKIPRKIRLSWYYGLPVHAGEKWQLKVRLKLPRGLMNPGSFDYEAWLFQHGIDATGYVRKSVLNKVQYDVPQALSWSALILSVNKIRHFLSQKIDAIEVRKLEVRKLEAKKSEAEKLAKEQGDGAQTSSFSLIKALAIGDKSSISKQQWQVLINTGTSHLMAISGLHIGLAAFFGYVLIRWLVPVFVMKRVPAQHVALSAGLMVAMSYAMVAGLSIPTQRAIIMLSVLSVMMLLRHNHRPFDALGFALLLVLLFDPLAVLSVGFWFSFSAVAVIFITLTANHAGDNKVIDNKAIDNKIIAGQNKKTVFYSVWRKVSSVLQQWVRLQFYITLFLLPLSLFMFQQTSLVSPIANLLLIPYVSFLVVPLVLLAIVFSFFAPDMADFLFNLAVSLLDFIWPLLSWFANQPYAIWVRGDVDIIKLLLVTTAMLMFYFSRELSNFITSYWRQSNTQMSNRRPARQPTIWLLRGIACLLFSALFITTKETFNTGEYQLTVLDVGNGSAAVIRTQNHVMVFDAGARFSDRFDIGSSVVLPYLRSHGLTALDYLIISHGDSDHIGGAQAILDALPETTVIGQHIEALVANKKLPCVTGNKWQWDGVDFVFLSPATASMANVKRKLRNNQSCVLRVSGRAGSVLFSGDIEKATEQQLLNRYGKKLGADVLIVPHHGSKTSSTAEFIQAVDPEISIFSVGYKNKHKHPEKKVLARYKEQGGTLLQTDKSGAITISLTRKAGKTIEKYRETARRYWHHSAD